MNRKMKAEGVRNIWDKYKYVGLVVLIGAVLLAWPGGSAATGQKDRQDYTEEAAERDIQAEMEAILGTISGVGQVKLMLTLDSDGERQLAQDTELSYSGSVQAPDSYTRRSETVLLDGGGEDQVVALQTRYPTYRGALVVCQGGDRAEVRLAVTEAVAALTGLTSDHITVAKWQ